jgi:DNA/RNA-binding domain of Phe-tRNA-synthetase-like protein
VATELEHPVEIALNRFRVSDAIGDTFPDACVAVVVALGMTNGASSEVSTSALADAAAALATIVDADGLREHPKIACWHDIYRRFNSKPRKYPCSVEALARRALRADSAVPTINCLVDFYNALSLRHLVPVGGEDLDTLSGLLELRPATGTEQFDIADDSSSEEVIVPAGEVVWADEVGVTCRRWNWRQGRRTRLTESTTNAYFIIDTVVPSTGESEVVQIVEELVEVLRAHGQAQHVGHRLLKVGQVR